jgi:NADP-dependent aldehyde dehydrogenase
MEGKEIVTSQSINPRTGQTFGPIFMDSPSHDIESIIEQGKGGFKAWSAASLARRANTMNAIADAIDKHLDALVEIADLETGLGIPRLTGEIGRTTFQIRQFAKAIVAGHFITSEVDEAVESAPPIGHQELVRAYSALGIVLVFGANNFPFAFSVLGGDTASALAAGCAVIAKAHPSHPQTSTKMYELATNVLNDQKFPPGVLSLIYGVEAGVIALRSEAVSAGAFTGSRTGGRALFNIAQSREIPIPFYGELGSVNPVLALPSGLSDPKAFAGAYLDSLLQGNGQFCTNPSILYVPENSSVISEIESQILDRAPTPFLSPSTKVSHDKNRAELSELLGSQPVTGKTIDDGGIYSPPAIIKTTTARLSMHSGALAIECFGPTGLVVTYSSITELLSLVGQMEGALTGSIFASADDDNAVAVCQTVAEKVGRLSWNSWPTGVAVSVGQQHGGPYPASTSSIHTSVGLHAISRFLRPVSYQNFPKEITDLIL